MWVKIVDEIKIGQREKELNLAFEKISHKIQGFL